MSALKLEPGETVIKKSRASLMTDLLISKQGTLTLTGKRLVFQPGFWSVSPEHIKTIDLPLGEITRVEAIKADTSNLIAGSLRKRLLIEHGDAFETYIVWGLARWVDAIRAAIG